ncbi:hypothetical protein KDX27_31310 [Burkholderia cenocepacia]|uniref:hypothetical protein n=1 Tax=Burkholderia cenocepacia TaxID=95486 RepID=UPI001BA268D6|nr:hypothetical protein [Burkholderia cenocepacia]MBR8029998.1 hypothetical protein [Burkholderia cenocepacia]MBR8172227.1 hypothetical protein [Burkholderia cenocepacia]
MDKSIDLVTTVLALIGGVLVASGLSAHLPLVENLGIPLERQAYVGGVLLLIAVALYFAMGGRIGPRQR